MDSKAFRAWLWFYKHILPVKEYCKYIIPWNMIHWRKHKPPKGFRGGYKTKLVQLCNKWAKQCFGEDKPWTVYRSETKGFGLKRKGGHTWSNLKKYLRGQLLSLHGKEQEAKEQKYHSLILINEQIYALVGVLSLVNHACDAPLGISIDGTSVIDLPYEETRVGKEIFINYGLNGTEFFVCELETFVYIFITAMCSVHNDYAIRYPVVSENKSYLMNCGLRHRVPQLELPYTFRLLEEFSREKSRAKYEARFYIHPLYRYVYPIIESCLRSPWQSDGSLD
ncbi:hypothetical protein PROFUN_16257 [Planoprotostelium fungivorum]|uniref:SET domain-containing protein n=1 Tax=Planoprotostelium fungivorum TaxID=1890364 RepID=A0A2P6MRM9_9EUKA|nr:hypothetical protein PROFUN_16257 [Planoprotostelium fungivorum]